MTAKKITSLDLAKAARDALLDKKGSDVVILDMRGISDTTDFYVIATGNNGPHIKALWYECENVMLKQRDRAYRHAGKPDSGWLVGDYWDVVVHVFTDSARQSYALETLWRDAKIVE